MKSRKIVFGLLAGFALAFFGYFLYCVSFLVKDSYTVIEGADLSNMLPPFVTADAGAAEASVSEVSGDNSEYVKTVNIKVFGLWDVAQASVKTIEAPTVYPSGECVGIKINTQGLIVSGFGDFETGDGMCVSPGARGGLKEGDIIEEINGIRTSSVSKFTEICDKSRGNCILTVIRDGKKINLKINGEQSKDGHMRLGIYVKNSLAGVGTVTYALKENGSFGALGHGITDSGVVVPIERAMVYKAEIMNVVKGKKGTPGEIIGAIDEGEVIGLCSYNTPEGVYGELSDFSPGFPKVEAAPSSEVRTGNAHIICTADSDGPRCYEAEIISVNHLRQNKTKSFSVEVTDKNLIEKTGGIVQGMSGSPVVQNGKLVGAVTHVFVNDPTRGYGIFIENMLAEAEKISD